MRKRLVMMFGLAIVFAVILSGCVEENILTQDIESTVYEVSQDFVRQALVAPSTAKFPPISEAHYIKEKSPNVWVVISYVDAQNRFGAYLRNYYACEIYRYGDNFKLSAINIEKNLYDVYWIWNFRTSINSFYETDTLSYKDYTIDIRGEIWKIEWEIGGVETYEYGGDISFSVRIYNENQSLIGFIHTLDSYDSGTEFIYEGDGTFYIEIREINVEDWTLKIHDGRDIRSP